MSYRRLVMVTTLIVIMISVIFFGGLTANVMSLLGLRYTPTHPRVVRALADQVAQGKDFRPSDRNPWRWLFRLANYLEITSAKTAAAGGDPEDVAVPQETADAAPIELPVVREHAVVPDRKPATKHEFKYATDLSTRAAQTKWTRPFYAFERKVVRRWLWRKEAIEEADIKDKVGYPGEGDQ
jgi:hypothetical protein